MHNSRNMIDMIACPALIKYAKGCFVPDYNKSKACSQVKQDHLQRSMSAMLAIQLLLTALK